MGTVGTSASKELNEEVVENGVGFFNSACSAGATKTSDGIVSIVFLVRKIYVPKYSLWRDSRFYPETAVG